MIIYKYQSLRVRSVLKTLVDFTSITTETRKPAILLIFELNPVVILFVVSCRAATMNQFSFQLLNESPTVLLICYPVESSADPLKMHSKTFSIKT